MRVRRMERSWSPEVSKMSQQRDRQNRNKKLDEELITPLSTLDEILGLSQSRSRYTGYADWVDQWWRKRGYKR